MLRCHQSFTETWQGLHTYLSLYQPLHWIEGTQMIDPIDTLLRTSLYWTLPQTLFLASNGYSDYQQVTYHSYKEDKIKCYTDIPKGSRVCYFTCLLHYTSRPLKNRPYNRGTILYDYMSKCHIEKNVLFKALSPWLLLRRTIIDPQEARYLKYRYVHTQQDSKEVGTLPCVYPLFIPALSLLYLYPYPYILLP